MTRYYVEALTAASPLSGERVGLDTAQPWGTIDANSPEEAALKLARKTNVLNLVVGVRVRVQPFDPREADEVWVRYENPDAPGEPMVRMPDYGEIRALRA